MKRIALIALVLNLSACEPAKIVTKTEQVEVTKYIKQPVDVSLTAPIVVTKPEAKCNDGTSAVLCNGPLNDYRLDLEHAIDQCNRDRKTIRDGQGDVPC